MVTTNIIKWDDANNQLTAFCEDDDGNTEIGPCKWDDANNKLEINCDSTDFDVKWDDSGNNLEARSVNDDCCEEIIECDDCENDVGPPCYFVEYDDEAEAGSGVITSQGDGSCTWWTCNPPNGTLPFSLELKFRIDHWALRIGPTRTCSFIGAGGHPLTPITNTFDCENGGEITYFQFGQNIQTILTPCNDCGDCPP